MSDNVNHPDHYTSGGIECIDAIRASLGDKEFADYCKGNIIKYLWRYRLKNGAEDLRKAQVYLNWMIEAEEKAEAKTIRKTSIDEQTLKEEAENLKELNRLYEDTVKSLEDFAIEQVARQVAAELVCPVCRRKDCAGPDNCSRED